MAYSRSCRWLVFALPLLNSLVACRSNGPLAAEDAPLQLLGIKGLVVDRFAALAAKTVR
jgi:hypothetical protein